MQHPAPAMVAMSLPARMRASLLGAWQQARPAQQLYVVPASDLVLVRLGRDAGDRHWPELLGGLAGRLDEASPGEAP